MMRGLHIAATLALFRSLGVMVRVGEGRRPHQDISVQTASSPHKHIPLLPEQFEGGDNLARYQLSVWGYCLWQYPALQQENPVISSPTHIYFSHGIQIQHQNHVDSFLWR